MEMLKTGNDLIVDLAACDGIEATDDAEGEVIMLGFYQKGVAVILTYNEALALGRVLSKMGRATRLNVGGADGYRA